MKLPDVIEHDPLYQITQDWNCMTNKVLNTEEISLEIMHTLLYETFKALTNYCRCEFVPKEISNILLSMEDFFHLASMIESERNLSYHCLELYIIMVSLRNGFFNERLSYDYPKLVIPYLHEKIYVMDFKKDSLEDYIETLHNS